MGSAEKSLYRSCVAQLTRKYFNKARGDGMAKLTVIHGKLRMS
jgi:hypothetical protein